MTMSSKYTRHRRPCIPERNSLIFGTSLAHFLNQTAFYYTQNDHKISRKQISSYVLLASGFDGIPTWDLMWKNIWYFLVDLGRPLYLAMGKNLLLSSRSIYENLLQFVIFIFRMRPFSLERLIRVRSIGSCWDE